MSTGVFLAVLGAALMHATWNAMIKQCRDRFASISIASFGMALAVSPGLFFVAFPAPKVWLLIVVSVALHGLYRQFLILAYGAGDMAQTYPLARGVAPLLTMIGGIFFLSEAPGTAAAAGIFLLLAGTVVMSLRGGAILGKINGRAVGYALITSVFIASYTLVDGTGARLVAEVGTFVCWSIFVDGVSALVLGMAVRGWRMGGVSRAEIGSGMMAGGLSAWGYAIALWAMTMAPVASVAMLRETSILFAMLISTLFLGEQMTRWRSMAALLIVAGVVSLRLG